MNFCQGSHLSSLFWWTTAFDVFDDEDAAKILPALEGIISSNGLRVWWLISMAKLDPNKMLYKNYFFK